MKRYNFAFGFLSIALLALSTAVSSGCTQRVDGVNIKSKAGKRPVASAGSSTAQIVSSEETDSAVTSSVPITSEESFVADLSDEERAKLASESLEKLNIKFKAKAEELNELIVAAATNDEKQKVFDANNPEPWYTSELLALAKKYPKTDASFEASMQIVINRTDAKEFPAAMDFVLDNHGERVQWQKICESYLEEIPSMQLENWMRKMIKNANSETVKAQTTHILYEYFDQFPTFASTIAYNKALEDRLPADQVQYIYNRKPEVRKDLLKMMIEIRDNMGDVKSRNGRPFSEIVTGPIFELENLNVGQVAPDIVGKDFDDIEFKLSDYRGKIVMLDFWGQWCPPCRAMYPHERDLVKNLAGKPFVLIGVNSDRKLDYARKSAEEENLIWRNYWNGPRGRLGNIAAQWNVSAWPTVYLIDAKGVIRYKEVLGSDIDKGLEVLLAEMGVEADIASSKPALEIPKQLSASVNH